MRLLHDYIDCTGFFFAENRNVESEVQRGSLCRSISMISCRIEVQKYVKVGQDVNDSHNSPSVVSRDIIVDESDAIACATF